MSWSICVQGSVKAVIHAVKNGKHYRDDRGAMAARALIQSELETGTYAPNVKVTATGYSGSGDREARGGYGDHSAMSITIETIILEPEPQD